MERDSLSCTRPQRADEKDLYGQRHHEQVPKAVCFFWPVLDPVQLSWDSRMELNLPVPALPAAV